MRRSIRGVADRSPLPMYYPGTPLAITCWYIYIFINYYLLEHRSTFDNCIVKVDYGIFNIQPSNQLSNIAFYKKRLMLNAGRRRSGFEATRLDFASALCVSSGLFFTLSRIKTYVIDNVLSMKSTITLHSTAHTNHTSYKNLLHAPMFTLTVKMSLQMFYSNIMAHMPSAYGLGKNTIFNKVQFSSVQQDSAKYVRYPRASNIFIIFLQ